MALKVTLCRHEAQEEAGIALVISLSLSPLILQTPCVNLPPVEGKIMVSYSFPCTLESVQCMAPSCSLGPTALGALSGQSLFLQVVSHLSASEVVSLAFWERNGPVTKSLWTELVLQTGGGTKLSLLNTVVLSAPRTHRETLKGLLLS